MTEPVSNPYKLPRTCETCQHGIWDKDGCYCNRVPSKTHKVCETGTCEHWALKQYIKASEIVRVLRGWAEDELEEIL